MLCDLITEWFQRTIMPDTLQIAYRNFINKVNNSQRFVLNREAVMTIHSISESAPKRFLDALSVCRLPYPSIWVEFPYTFRSEWMKEAQTRGMIVESHQHASPPSRLGFLLEQQDDEGRIISVVPAWYHEDHDIASICHLSLVINTGGEAEELSTISKTVLKEDIVHKSKIQGNYHRWMNSSDGIAAGIALEARIHEDVPDFMLPTWQALLQTSSKTDIQTVLELARFDLKSEWRFILALLTVLNSRNVVEVSEEIDVSKLNKARKRSGKPLLLTHRVIRLNMSKVQKGRLKGGTVIDLQKHLVRGHWKIRKSGLFWWTPFVRGNVGEAHVTTTHVKG